jgi:radical SAM superfamily enzyme YgiQ (UPF0313 family)
VEDIIAEMKSARHKLFFIVDDSIFSDRAFARRLFAEIRKLKIVWTTQITLDFAADRELLALMKSSGCEMVLIGFESVDSGNLKQMNKTWSEKLGRRDELVSNVHDAGIGIYASFVFGFDKDNKESFEIIFAFAMKHRFYIAAFNHLLTFPGTGTYRNFAAEGRMDGSAWWLQGGYTFGTIAFKPKQLSPEKLRELCAAYKRRFFSFSAIAKRGAALFRRTKSLKLNGIFWLMNLLFHLEVDKRLGIPLGENLDGRGK